MRARQFWRQHVRSWPRAVATQRRRASNQTNQLPRSIPHQPNELYLATPREPTTTRRTPEKHSNHTKPAVAVVLRRRERRRVVRRE